MRPLLPYLLVILSLASLCCRGAHLDNQPAPAENAITAITIALEPDSRAILQLTAINDRLRSSAHRSFAFDQTHRPHLTILQRYVRTKDLDKVYAAVTAAVASQHIAPWTLQAYQYGRIPWGDVDLLVVKVRKIPELVRLQGRLIKSIKAFTVDKGPSSAFFRDKGDAPINSSTIDHVENFVRASSGLKYKPEITVGALPKAMAKPLAAQPLEPLTFSPAAISIFQLGNFGAARARLKTWKLN